MPKTKSEPERHVIRIEAIRGGSIDLTLRVPKTEIVKLIGTITHKSDGAARYLGSAS